MSSSHWHPRAHMAKHWPQAIPEQMPKVAMRTGVPNPPEATSKMAVTPPQTATALKHWLLQCAVICTEPNVVSTATECLPPLMQRLKHLLTLPIVSRFPGLTRRTKKEHCSRYVLAFLVRETGHVEGFRRGSCCVGIDNAVRGNDRGVGAAHSPALT